MVVLGSLWFGSRLALPLHLFVVGGVTSSHGPVEVVVDTCFSSAERRRPANGEPKTVSSSYKCATSRSEATVVSVYIHRRFILMKPVKPLRASFFDPGLTILQTIGAHRSAVKDAAARLDHLDRGSRHLGYATQDSL